MWFFIDLRVRTSVDACSGAGGGRFFSTVIQGRLINSSHVDQFKHEGSLNSIKYDHEGCKWRFSLIVNVVEIIHAVDIDVYLDISVDADGRVVDALQAFESHRTLLLIVNEEDDDPAREVQQDPDRRTFADAAVRPARSEMKKRDVHVRYVLLSGHPAEQILY